MPDSTTRAAAQERLRNLLNEKQNIKTLFKAAFPEFTAVLLDPGSEATSSGGFSTKTNFMDWDADHPNGQCIYVIARK